MKRLEGKVALITGAGSGIGRSSAKLFAEEGAKITVVDIDAKGGEETVKMIRKAGGDAVFIQADVSKAADAERMVKRTVEEWGGLDILFNNAGVYVESATAELSEEDWDRLMAVNLKGPFLGSKYAIPQMIKQGDGVIINTASDWGIIGWPKAAAYCSSKGGLILLTKSLAMELAPYNIRVNSLCPAAVATPINIAWMSKMPKEEADQMIKSRIPLGRMSKPEEQAYGALFLASDESSYVTGTIFLVDGGSTAH